MNVSERLPRLFVATLVLVGGVGCDVLSSAGVEERAGPVTVETNKQSYSEADSIEFAVSNAASDSLSLYFCNRLIFQTQKRQGGEWTSFSGTICKAVYPIEFKPAVAPSEAYQSVISIREEGTYRLQLKYKLGSGEKLVQSNEFTVE